jgi:hypothetical protein
MQTRTIDSTGQLFSLPALGRTATRLWSAFRAPHPTKTPVGTGLGAESAFQEMLRRAPAETATVAVLAQDEKSREAAAMKQLVDDLESAVAQAQRWWEIIHDQSSSEVKRVVAYARWQETQVRANALRAQIYHAGK